MKSARFANGKNRRVRSRHKDLHALLRSGLADIDDLAPCERHFRSRFVSRREDRSFHISPCIASLHCPVKRIVGQADRECAVSRGKCLVRPLDEFREVIKKGGFDLIFDGAVLYCGRVDAKQNRKAAPNACFIGGYL